MEDKMYISPDVLKEFEVWFNDQTADDPDFEGVTLQDLLSRAEAQSQRCVDELLNLPRRENTTLREWVGINFVQLDSGNPFPTVRRVGGDHDRGFSPALNAEMKKTHEE